MTAPDARRDSPLPRPLEDPLRAVRRYTGFLLVVQLIFIAVGTISLLAVRLPALDPNPPSSDRAGDVKPPGPRPGPPDETVAPRRIEFSWWEVIAFGCVALVIYTFAVWRVLPNRPVEVLYLRSFRRDVGTAPVRRSLQAVLGRSVRLSGIRSPRFRWPKVVRYALIYLFVMRHVTARYMNLEAGEDWKARLWRTLGDVRGVVIDVSDLTPYVVEEVRLCHRCLGLDRILFVGDSGKTQDEWKTIVRDVLGVEVYLGRIRLAIWDDRTGWQEPAAGDLRGFAVNLPAEAAGLAPDARPLAQDNGRDYSPGWAGWLWVELLVGVALGFVLQSLYASQLPGDAPSQRLALVPSLAILLVEFWAFLFYLRDCGLWRERLLAAATFVPGGAVLAAAYLVTVLDVPAMVRAETEKLRTRNHLKMIGIALHDHHDVTGRFPEAAGPGDRVWTTDRRPPVSWRVKLLPYLGSDRANYISANYRTDQPWDSSHNRQFVRLMPSVYALPGKPADALAGNTYYRVLLGRSDRSPRPAFTQDRTVKLGADFPDGSSHTLLVVEAAEAVPWTKPDELLYDPEQPLPPLGRHFRGGFHAVLADGLVRFFAPDTPDEELRAWITRDGGEPIDAGRRPGDGSGEKLAPPK